MCLTDAFGNFAIAADANLLNPPQSSQVLSFDTLSSNFIEVIIKEALRLG